MKSAAVIKAFLLAPIAAPFAFFVFFGASSWVFAEDCAWPWADLNDFVGAFLGIMMVGLPISYAVTAICGVPIFWALSRLNRLNGHLVLLSASTIGASLFALTWNRGEGYTILLGGVSGFAAGLAFWLLVRQAPNSSLNPDAQKRRAG